MSTQFTMTNRTKIMVEEVMFLTMMGESVEFVCKALGRTPHSIVKVFEYYKIPFNEVGQFRAYARELKLKKRREVNV